MALSHPTIPTFGGDVTRGETFSKLLYHLDETRSLCAVMAHLHRTEDSRKDATMAQGWLAIEQLLHRMRTQITKLAQGTIQ